MTDQSDEPEGNYALVMPFVVCEDQGGPYKADAFVAGWECGAIDTLLRTTRPFGVTVERFVKPAIVPQLDLIAMQHGYKLTTEPWDEYPDDWTRVTFAPAEVAE